jgi:hypothetical protein
LTICIVGLLSGTLADAADGFFEPGVQAAESLLNEIARRRFALGGRQRARRRSEVVEGRQDVRLARRRVDLVEREGELVSVDMGGHGKRSRRVAARSDMYRGRGDRRAQRWLPETVGVGHRNQLWLGRRPGVCDAARNMGTKAHSLACFGGWFYGESKDELRRGTGCGAKSSIPNGRGRAAAGSGLVDLICDRGKPIE